MSEITWRAKKHIVVPNDIRSVLESSSTTPFNPPPAAVELLRELKAKTSKMTSTAWHQQVFKAPSADDEEETQTRWNSQPTGSVILLARRPVSNGNMVSLTFRDESTIDFVPGFYNFRLAKALLTHSVRVSLFYIKDMLDKENSWLYQHVRNSVLVVCPSDSLECVPVNSVTSPNYELSYTSEWGLQANRTTAYQQTPQTEEETWF
jgi:hypothetical protein